MVTTTSRLGLNKPDTTDLVDIAVLNQNADKLDAAAGATICTSSTRPTTPFNGQIIFETNTNSTLVYKASTSSWTIVGGVDVCTSSTRPSLPYEGQQIFETDTKKEYTYVSGTWEPTVNSGSVLPVTNSAYASVVASQAARDALFPSPAQGNAVWRSDKGWEERYFALYNSSTNPGGATPAGWYPVSGNMPKASVVKSGNTSLTGSAWNVLNGAGVFAENVAPVGMDAFYATSSDGCFKAPLTGVYRVSLMIHTDTVTSTGPQAWAVDKNNTATGASYPDTVLLFSAANTGNTSWTTATGGHNLVKLSANDKLRIHVYNYGATIQFTGDTYSIFSLEWVGPNR